MGNEDNREMTYGYYLIPSEPRASGRSRSPDCGSAAPRGGRIAASGSTQCCLRKPVF